MKSLKRLKDRIISTNSKLNKYAYACFLGVCDNYNTDGFTTVEGTVDKVHSVITVAVWGSTAVAMGIIIYGAYLFITAAGDDGKIEQGNKTITAGIVGLIIVFAANLIIRYVMDKIIVG